MTSHNWLGKRKGQKSHAVGRRFSCAECGSGPAGRALMRCFPLYVSVPNSLPLPALLKAGAVLGLS